MFRNEEIPPLTNAELEQKIQELREKWKHALGKDRRLIEIRGYCYKKTLNSRKGQ